jgi:hypothetical protein
MGTIYFMTKMEAAYEFRTLKFSANTAVSGSAFALGSEAAITMSEMTFVNNSAPVIDAISSTRAKLNIQRATFVGNYVLHEHKAYIIKLVGVDLSASDLEFSGHANMKNYLLLFGGALQAIGWRIDVNDDFKSLTDHGQRSETVLISSMASNVMIHQVVVKGNPNRNESIRTCAFASFIRSTVTIRDSTLEGLRTLGTPIILSVGGSLELRGSVFQRSEVTGSSVCNVQHATLFISGCSFIRELEPKASAHCVWG